MPRAHLLTRLRLQLYYLLQVYGEHLVQVQVKKAIDMAPSGETTLTTWHYLNKIMHCTIIRPSFAPLRLCVKYLSRKGNNRACGA